MPVSLTHSTDYSREKKEEKNVFFLSDYKHEIDFWFNMKNVFQLKTKTHQAQSEIFFSFLFKKQLTQSAESAVQQSRIRCFSEDEEAEFYVTGERKWMENISFWTVFSSIHTPHDIKTKRVENATSHGMIASSMSCFKVFDLCFLYSLQRSVETISTPFTHSQYAVKNKQSWLEIIPPIALAPPVNPLLEPKLCWV